MIIREMIPEDWERVLEIYKQGIDSGETTFSTKVPHTHCVIHYNILL